MQFELYGKNKVQLSPGGYYDLNQNNYTELMVVKLALLQAHIEAAINQVAETSEEPKSLTNGSDIMKLADTIYAKYQQDIESGNKKMFEQKDVYTNKDYDYMHPTKNHIPAFNEIQGENPEKWEWHRFKTSEGQGPYRVTLERQCDKSKNDSIIIELREDHAAFPYITKSDDFKAIAAVPTLIDTLQNNLAFMDSPGFREVESQLKTSHNDGIAKWEGKSYFEMSADLRREETHAAIIQAGCKIKTNATPVTENSDNTENSDKSDFILDGWKTAAERSKDNIDGAIYDKWYGGIDGAVLYEMTIAEREGKYIPYHGSIAMDKCETIIEAAKAIDTYYNDLATEHKYSEMPVKQKSFDYSQALNTLPDAKKVIFDALKDKYGEQYTVNINNFPSLVGKGNAYDGFFKINVVVQIDKNIKVRIDDPNKNNYNFGNPDPKPHPIIPCKNINEVFATIDGLLIKHEKSFIPKITPPFPNLSPTEAKELTDFTTAITKAYPTANHENLTKLCTIASDMQKYTIQNANGTLSNEHHTSLTDNQEKQVKELIKDLPQALPSFPYVDNAPAIKLYITGGQVINVPEIPKNKLTVTATEPTEPTKTTDQTAAKKR